MRKFLIPIAAAASTLALAAPASAQIVQWAPPVYQYNPYNFGNGYNGGYHNDRDRDGRDDRYENDHRWDGHD